MAASIYLFKPPHAIGPVPSLSGHGIAYRWHSLPRVRRHRASKPQGISSSGCCLCITMDQLIICVSLSRIHYCPESIALTPLETQQGYCSTVVHVYTGLVVLSYSDGKKHRSSGGWTLNADPPRPPNCSRIGATGRGTVRAFAHRQAKQGRAAGHAHLHVGVEVAL